MKKKNIITSFALALAFLPLYAGAETASTTSVSAPATEAQVFTACSQASIEIRDNAIGVARTAYNSAMSVALTARKEAEKGAVALADASEKKEAIRVAVEEYKKAITSAQEGLTTARKEAWGAFEANTNNCRDISKEARREAADEKKVELRSMQTEQQEDVEELKPETKSFRESFFDQLESIKNFFKKGQDSK